MNRFALRRRMMMDSEKPNFPDVPERYIDVGNLLAEGTYTAPKDGYYMIEVYGASAPGGAGAHFYNLGGFISVAASGGGGGGGGFGSSKIKMRRGDKIHYRAGSFGNDSTAEILSSIDKSHTITVQSAKAGEEPPDVWDIIMNLKWNDLPNIGNILSGLKFEGGKGGTGGTSFNGNYLNSPGGNGKDGNIDYSAKSAPARGTKGVSPAVNGKNGGNGGTGFHTENFVLKKYPGEDGAAGFVKIYYGDKN